MIKRLRELLDDHFDEMVQIRRHLHQHPELSFEEYETAAYIKEYHEALGHEVEAKVGGNGVVARLKGRFPGKTIALRADFDALPIQEENDVPYRSNKDGVMHACGHDGHTAMLLVLAKVFQQMKDDIHGEIVFIHQHGEEKLPGGAKPMIEAGALDGVDAIFGNHLIPMYPLGEIQYNHEAFMASGDVFEITVKGKSGHGALPHLSKDAITIASQLVVYLQQIVSRRVDPIDTAVVSVGSFVAENAFNVLAGSAKLEGTVRTFKEDTREFVEEEMKRIIEGVCHAAGAEFDFTYTRGYPAVINHQEETDVIVHIAKTIPEVSDVIEMEPMMGGDDYAYYLQRVKGTYFITGAGNPEWDEVYPNHHPKFDFDERAMLIGAKILGEAAINYSKQKE